MLGPADNGGEVSLYHIGQKRFTAGDSPLQGSSIRPVLHHASSPKPGRRFILLEAYRRGLPSRG